MGFMVNSFRDWALIWGGLTLALVKKKREVWWGTYPCSRQKEKRGLVGVTSAAAPTSPWSRHLSGVWAYGLGDRPETVRRF